MGNSERSSFSEDCFVLYKKNKKKNINDSRCAIYWLQHWVTEIKSLQRANITDTNWKLKRYDKIFAIETAGSVTFANVSVDF